MGDPSDQITDPAGEPRRGLSAFGAYVPHGLVVVAAALGLWALKRVDFLSGSRPLFHGALLVGLTILLAPVRSRSTARPLLLVARTLAVLFAFYALAAYPSVSDHYLDRSRYGGAILLWGGPIALAAAVLTWFRPGFCLVPPVIIAWKKHELARLFGFGLNATDYLPVAEVSVFVALGIGAAGLAARLRPRAAGTVTFGEAVFVAALAAHLSGYFWSAIAKATLPGAGPFTWVLENETHNIMLAARACGLGPLVGQPALAEFAHEAVLGTERLVNVLTFAGELAALFAVLRIRFGAVLICFYQLMHVGIFFTTSILFWKWMSLNAGLLLGLRRLGRAEPFRAGWLPWPLASIGLGVVLLAPRVFRSASLGWYDSSALNRPTVLAVLDDGRRVAVPTVFFLEASAQLAKSRLGKPFEGHFEEILTFGKVKDGLEQLRRAEARELEVADRSGLEASFARDPALETFFREHHRFVREHLREDGTYPYYWFPHHNWSNPAFYREFEALDLRRVVAYDYCIDSVYLDYAGNGEMEETVVLHGEYRIPVVPRGGPR